jgi:thiol-disulfide isomerase/thioredoxin
MTQTLIPYMLSLLLAFSNPFTKVYEEGCAFCWVYEKAQEVSKEVKEPVEVKKPVERNYRILHFTATWCGPCKVIERRFGWMKTGGWTIGEDFSNHVQLIDSDRNPKLIQEFRIVELPHSVLIRNGVVVSRLTPRSAEDLITLFNNNIN